jgi:hypothetical protein
MEPVGTCEMLVNDCLTTDYHGIVFQKTDHCSNCCETVFNVGKVALKSNSLFMLFIPYIVLYCIT